MNDIKKPRKNSAADILKETGKAWKDTIKLIILFPVFLKSEGLSTPSIIIKYVFILTPATLAFIGTMFWVGWGVIPVVIGLIIVAIFTSIINSLFYN